MAEDRLLLHNRWRRRLVGFGLGVLLRLLVRALLLLEFASFCFGELLLLRRIALLGALRLELGLASCFFGGFFGFGSFFGDINSVY